MSDALDEHGGQDSIHGRTITNLGLPKKHDGKVSIGMNHYQSAVCR